MLSFDATRRRGAGRYRRATIESEATDPGAANGYADNQWSASFGFQGMKAEDESPAIQNIDEIISYLFEREGDAIRRLRGIATTLGLALVLCDGKGRSVAIDEPAEKLAHGGIPPKVRQRVFDYIEENLDKSISLDDLAQVAGLSRCHFLRAFKQSIGTTPHYYLMQRRVEYASALLRETDIPLAEIALQCGFSDQSHLCRRFRMFFKSTPRLFRRYHR